jgi:hypothetical protein
MNMDLEQREEQRAADNKLTPATDNTMRIAEGPPIPNPHPKTWVIQCSRCGDTILVIGGIIDRVSADLIVYCGECYEHAWNRPVIP